MGEMYDKTKFSDPMDRKIVFVQYIECMVKGEWKQQRGEQDRQDIWKIYVAGIRGNSELWIVRPDGLRRAWCFKAEALIHVGQSAIRFLQEDVVEEIAIDEDQQNGGIGKPRVA